MEAPEHRLYDLLPWNATEILDQADRDFLEHPPSKILRNVMIHTGCILHEQHDLHVEERLRQRPCDP